MPPNTDSPVAIVQRSISLMTTNWVSTPTQKSHQIDHPLATIRFGQSRNSPAPSPTARRVLQSTSFRSDIAKPPPLQNQQAVIVLVLAQHAAEPAAMRRLLMGDEQVFQRRLAGQEPSAAEAYEAYKPLDAADAIKKVYIIVDANPIPLAENCRTGHQDLRPRGHDFARC